MRRTQPKFDLSMLMTNTAMAQRRVTAAIKLAHDLETDADRARRLTLQRCKACHYFTRMAGQAFTYQPCACCGEPQTYSTTSVDLLCPACAKKHDLCKHCSGDIEMRTGRAAWPDKA